MDKTRQKKLDKMILMIPVLIIGLFVVAFCFYVFVICGPKPYPFNEPLDEIDSIEIVSAEDSSNYTVIKSLSETEKSSFLESFQTIKFRRYIYGDPKTVKGDAVKITYNDGTYEMIGHYWSDYVVNGSNYLLFRSCADRKAFAELIDSFSK